ncbi:MAG: nitronate monooxygenase [Variovorax sp.]|nr:MAG: nitronate monooxygenase [Variovorax sp.]
MAISDRHAYADALAAGALHRPVCELLQCRYPLLLAGMGGVARSDLVSAVSRAGGFGLLGMVRETPELIDQEVAKVRAASTTSSFGVSIIPAATEPTLLNNQIAACVDLKAPAVCLFWDLSLPAIKRFRAAGILVICQVGSLEEAKAAQRAGAQVLVVQGMEAGGHVRGRRPLCELVLEVLGEVDIPVLVAGGLVDGRDVATYMALGAQGAMLGTALLATKESFAHEYHKQAILKATADDTILTQAFHINWPSGAAVRVLQNSVTRGEHGDPHAPEKRVIGAECDRPIYLFSTDSPLRSTTGNLEAMALYAGRGAERIRDLPGAAERIDRIVLDASEALFVPTEAVIEPIEVSSPVCYVAEMVREYLDLADEDAVLTALNDFLEAERAGLRVLLDTFALAGDQSLKAAAQALLPNTVKRCGALVSAIQDCHGRPSVLTGHAYQDAQKLPDFQERLKFIADSQVAWTKNLKGLLPRLPEGRLQNELREILILHDLKPLDPCG